jgi:serine/threonine-protein kinase
MTEPAFVTQELDGVEFRLAKPADLSFVQRYGRVFRVFDDHDSGNISFGVDNGQRRLFIKVAGARTMYANVSPEEAIATQANSVDVHREIEHPHIVKLVNAVRHDPYSALVFKWAEGELLRRVNEESFARFRGLSLEDRMAAFDTVIEVLQHVQNCGWVAVDVYDASFIYDFGRKHLTLIDLEVFARKPMVNEMGRMWGSSRFMSPEEYQLGADIDEITNVYTLGAVAFLFFGEERVRMIDTWDAGEARFEVGQRATSDARADRYESIAAFAAAWRNA